METLPKFGVSRADMMKRIARLTKSDFVFTRPKPVSDIERVIALLASAAARVGPCA